MILAAGVLDRASVHTYGERRVLVEVNVVISTFYSKGPKFESLKRNIITCFSRQSVQAMTVTTQIEGRRSVRIW